MPIPLQLQTYNLNDQQFQLYVPEPQFVQTLYKEQKKINTDTPFPYWTQVWPAALAMGKFLLQNPQYIQNKKVLELGAGLGLPSIIASAFALEVCCSDYLPEAVEVIKQSVTYNKLDNVQCEVLDWTDLPSALNPEVLILSDINYNPPQFEILFTVLVHFLKKGSLILLSTPQRLMAKPFIERLLPFCIYQEEVVVAPYGEQELLTTVLVLR